MAVCECGWLYNRPMNFDDSVCGCIGAGQSARETCSHCLNVGRRLSRPARTARHPGRGGEMMRHLQRSSRQIASPALSRPYTYTRYSFPTHTRPEERAPLWSAFQRTWCASGGFQPAVARRSTTPTFVAMPCGLKPAANIGSALKRTEERACFWSAFQRTWCASGGFQPAVDTHIPAPVSPVPHGPRIAHVR